MNTLKATSIILFTVLGSFLLTTGIAYSLTNPYLPYQGGTGTSTTPSYGDVLVGNADGTYGPRATSTLGIASIADGTFSTTSANYWETQQTSRIADNLGDNNLDDLLDVITSGQAAGNVLAYDGSVWKAMSTSSYLVSSELDTIAELESQVGSVNILLETEIDASSELAALMNDETGSGGNLVFSSNPLLSGFRSYASSTIGGGTALTGLTVNGSASTTGNHRFGSLAQGFEIRPDNSNTNTATGYLRTDSSGNTVLEPGSSGALYLNYDHGSTNTTYINGEKFRFQNAGAIFNASSTIGAGTLTTGLTVNGGATTTATATLAAARVQGAFSFGGVTGTQWSDFCTAITGGSGLCDGSDDGGGGGSQTPWTSNIDGGGYNLANAGSITAATIHTTSTAATSTGAGPWRLVANGAYGGWGSTDGGLLNLRMGTNPGAALNIVTDADDTSSDSPLLYVEATNSGYENQLLRLIHASGCGNCAQIRMDSPAPQIEWVETDQVGTNGSGKFEMQVNGNQFNIAPRLFDNSGFQNAYEFAHTWLNPSTLLTISASTTSATMNAIKIANTISSAGAQPGIAWSNTPGSITSARISSASGSGHANSILAFEVADASKVLLERARFDVNGDFGIGTTSPWGRLSVKGTSTDPAFVVASSSGSQMLTIGGLSNTIMELFANTGTKLLSAVSETVTLLGTWDFSGATVKMHTYPAFSYSTSTAWTGSTTIPLGPAYTAENWAGVKCFTDTGTLWINFNDGTNKTSHLQASTTVNAIALSSNNTFTASEKRYVEIGNPASSPTKISCTVDKIINN